MSLINRVSRGFLFEDQFSSPTLDPIWQASPSDDTRYSLTDRSGYLRLKHGEPSIYMLLNVPRHDFVFEADTDYKPVTEKDTGGLVMFRDRDTKVEMLEYYDPDTGSVNNWNRIRFVRKGDLVEGYGSNDGGLTWELVGITYFNAYRVGLALHGREDLNTDPLDVSAVRMYRETNVQVGNLVPGLRVDLVDENGAVISSSTCKEDTDHVRLDVSKKTFPLTGRVQIFDSAGYPLDETEVFNDIWGGDMFWYGVQLDLEIDGVHLRIDREYQLGNMESGIIERRAYLINNNSISLYNIRASVQAYGEYYGWEWAEISSEIFGEPTEYRKKILIGDIKPGQRIPVWLKITRRPYHQMASLQDYKFRIMLESG